MINDLKAIWVHQKQYILMLIFAILTLFASWFRPINIQCQHVSINVSTLVLLPAFISCAILAFQHELLFTIKSCITTVCLTTFSFGYGQFSLLLPGPDHAAHINTLYHHFIISLRESFFAFTMSFLAIFILCIVLARIYKQSFRISDGFGYLAAILVAIISIIIYQFIYQAILMY